MATQARKYLNNDDSVIPLHFPRLLFEVASEQCADRSGLLSGTGITLPMFESPDARISSRQYARLCRNALRLTGNSGLGIDVGSRVQPANLGMLGLAAMSSPDTKTAIEFGIKYYRAIAPFWDISMQVTDGIARITFREGVSLQALRVMATEIVLSGFASLGRALLGREAPCIKLELDYPKPPHARRYVELTNAPVSFGRPTTQFVLEEAALHERLRFADPITARLAERQCAADLAPTASADGLVAHVRRLLEASPGRYPSPEELARALQTSERTLRRDLVDMGTSYQSMIDIARCKHATELLTGTDMSINEIAEQLGFSEGRALRRAFKRWTGHTAAKYRKEERHSSAREA